MTTSIFGVPDYLNAIGAQKVSAAQQAFAVMMQQIAGSNIIQQITAAGKTDLIGNAVKDVLYWGSTGSLWEAYKSIEKIQITPEMAPFLTEAIKQEAKNKIIAAISSL